MKRKRSKENNIVKGKWTNEEKENLKFALKQNKYKNWTCKISNVHSYEKQKPDKKLHWKFEKKKSCMRGSLEI